jgi:hypothetical protein
MPWEFMVINRKMRERHGPRGARRAFRTAQMCDTERRKHKMMMEFSGHASNI